MIKKIFLTLIIYAYSLISYAYAGNHYFDMSLEELMKIKVITASKQEETAFESASAAYVITNEDIRRSGATSVPEALRLAPGVQVARIDSDEWAVSIRGFNDRFADKLLVLVDGRSAYVPLFSGVYWNTLDYIFADIDRIEVIRGSGGSIWGANAVNGIINIITKNPKHTQGTHISIAHGDYEKIIAEARYGSKTKQDAYYSVYAKNTKRGDLTDAENKTDAQDDWEMNRVGFKYEKALDNADSNLVLQGDIYDGNSSQLYDLPDGTEDNLIHNTADITGGNMLFQYNKILSSDSKINIQSYIDYDDREMFWLNAKGYNFDIDVQHLLRYNDKNDLLYGFEYRNVHDNLKPSSIDGVTYMTFEPEKMTFDVIDLFFQNKTELIIDKLYFTIGSKFGYNSLSHDNIQPTARISYFPKETHHLWAAVSRVVRTPTRWEDGMTRKLKSGKDLSGNKQYGDESNIAYEAGYKIQFFHKFSFDLAGFYNDYDDLRRLITDNSGNITIDNNLKGESYGFEITTNYEFNNRLRLALIYSFARINIPVSDSNKYIEGRLPRNQLSARSYYNITDKLQWDNMIYYADNLTDNTYDGVSIDAYIRYDTRFNYKINKNLDISLIGRNLTDHYHQEFGQSLYSRTREVGRSFLLKMNYNF